MKKLALFLQLTVCAMMICVGVAACRQTQSKPMVINIQPLDGIKISDEDVEKFDNYLKNIGLTNYQICVLPHDYSPYDGCLLCDAEMGSKPTRLRADTMVRVLNAPEGEFTVGVTDRDISATVHGVQDFGVLGLSYLGHKYRSVMTSTFRLKKRKDLWKLMAHEFTHGYFSQPHCKADDPHCIMQDAKKKPNFGIKDSICNVCREEIKQKLNN